MRVLIILWRRFEGYAPRIIPDINERMYIRAKTELGKFRLMMNCRNITLLNADIPHPIIVPLVL